jgi:hypothetical protein
VSYFLESELLLGDRAAGFHQGDTWKKNKTKPNPAYKKIINFDPILAFNVILLSGANSGDKHFRIWR